MSDKGFFGNCPACGNPEAECIEFGEPPIKIWGCVKCCPDPHANPILFNSELFKPKPIKVVLKAKKEDE